MIKGVLFDLDGTLLNTNELIYKSFDYMFKTVLHKELCQCEINKLYGVPLEKSLAQYADSEEKLAEMISVYRKSVLDNHDSMCRAFDEVPELLKILKKKKIKIGIVTSKKRDIVERGLKLTKIFEYMDVIITPEDTKKHKPFGEPALKACEVLRLKPSETIMAGDSPYDLLCAKEAGCLSCGVEYTAIGVEKLKEVNPDYMIKKPLDLLEVI